jgi:hypothetical protein
VGRKFVVYIGVRGAKLVGMSDWRDKVEVGDILTFPPFHRERWKVTAKSPEGFTIIPLFRPVPWIIPEHLRYVPETEKEP